MTLPVSWSCLDMFSTTTGRLLRDWILPPPVTAVVDVFLFCRVPWDVRLTDASPFSETHDASLSLFQSTQDKHSKDVEQRHFLLRMTFSAW